MRSNFAILNFLETDIVALSLPIKASATYVSHRYGSESDFNCVNHLDKGFYFATKITANIFFNNKQRLSRYIFRKESVPGFKKSQPCSVSVFYLSVLLPPNTKSLTKK